MPDPLKPYLVEVDSSDVATGGILSQHAEDQQWYLGAYLSKSLSDAERNYDIYDKELLAMIRGFEAWRHYLEGAPHKIQVFTDHKNLEYFTRSQKLISRQARWALFLTRFDFRLQHLAGSKNRADGLSRRADLKGDVKLDNTEKIFFLSADIPVNAAQLISMDNV